MQDLANFMTSFLNSVWDFLDAPALFGISLKGYLVGGFVVRLSIGLFRHLFSMYDSAAEFSTSQYQKKPIPKKRVKGFGG